MSTIEQTVAEAEDVPEGYSVDPVTSYYGTAEGHAKLAALTNTLMVEQQISHTAASAIAYKTFRSSFRMDDINDLVNIAQSTWADEFDWQCVRRGGPELNKAIDRFFANHPEA